MHMTHVVGVGPKSMSSRTETQPTRVDPTQIRSWDGTGFDLRHQIASLVIGAGIGGGIGALASFGMWTISGGHPGISAALTGGGLVLGAAMNYTDSRQHARNVWESSERRRVGTDIETIVDNEFTNWDVDGNGSIDRPDEWQLGPVYDSNGNAMYWDRTRALERISGHEDGRITKDELTATLQSCDDDHNGGINAAEAKAVDRILNGFETRNGPASR